jgi:predicted nucleotidyltransferase
LHPSLVDLATYDGQMASTVDLRALVEDHAPQIRALTRKHNGRTIQLFGSVARGDAGKDSDIDFLVQFEPGSSLFDLLHLQDDLEALLDRRVDVVSSGGLKERDTHIRREAIAL